MAEHDERRYPVAPGDVVAGKYRVERVLGAGGMGVVVAAHHLALDARVALKFLLPRFEQDGVVRARFEREARACSALRSEHVARVLDVGLHDGGTPYIVMELLKGEDVQHVVEREGPLPAARAVELVLQACEAIAEAHALGIVHRDLKPENLFLTQRVDGRPLVKVLDFGISKASAADGRHLTATGDVIGTPQYMSPEQLRGSRAVDAGTDIWAVGAILYTLLAGRPAFDGDTMAQICTRVMFEAPQPLGSLRPDVPADLVAVIASCLEKERAARFATAGDLVAALQPFLRAGATRSAAPPAAIRAPSLPPTPAATTLALQPTLLAPAPRPRRGRRWLLMAMVLGGGAVASVGALATRVRPATPSAAATPAQSASAQPAPAAAAASSREASIPAEALPAVPSATPPDAAARVGRGPARTTRPTLRGSGRAEPPPTSSPPSTRQ